MRPHAPIVHECQRWLFRQARFRPTGETINTHAHEVAPIADDNTPKTFVEAHHYSGSYPAARERFGLYRRAGELVGVAVFSVPCRPEVLTSVFPGDPLDSLELGRFVLLDSVASMGETFFLGQCLRVLRRASYRGVVSFSDPFPRASLDGRTVLAGHVGTIYQGGNMSYLGRSQRRTLKLLPDGRILSARALSKIRAGERGWRHASAVLESFGASPAPEDLEPRRAWLRAWLPRITRTVRHPGNHRYAYSLTRTAPIYGPFLAAPKRAS